MPKLNRFIVLSIIADIKEFIRVANEMCSWVGRIEHLSWRFPTRSAQNVNAIELVQQHRGSAGEMYILLLELAYDRIHFVLRLIVEFMDHYPFIEDFFTEVTNVKRPENMTLANVIHVLWARLKLLPESIAKNLVKTKKIDELFVGRVSRGCQASGALTCCESCSIAGRMITELMSDLDRVFQEHNMISVAASERKLLAIDIFDKTQWTVMNRLVEAIQEDIKTMFTAMRTAKSRTESYKGDYEKMMKSLQTELKNKQSEMNALEAKNKELSEQIRSVMIQLKRLKNSQLEMGEKNLTLVAALAKVEERISHMDEWNFVLQQQITGLVESKQALEHTVLRMHEDVVAAKQSCSEIESLQMLLIQLQNENVSIKAQYDDRIKRLEHDLADLQRVHECNDKVAAESNRSRDEEAMVNLKSALGEETVITPEDDPELDMTQHMASNQETIDKLMRQNERLSKTLNRLREHRRMTGVE